MRHYCDSEVYWNYGTKGCYVVVKARNGGCEEADPPPARTQAVLQQLLPCRVVAAVPRAQRRPREPQEEFQHILAQQEVEEVRKKRKRETLTRYFRWHFLQTLNGILDKIWRRIVGLLPTTLNRGACEDKPGFPSLNATMMHALNAFKCQEQQR